MKKIFSLLLIFSVGICVSAHAELVWKSGYVILNNGDSIKGDVHINTKKELPLFSKVSLKQGENTKTYKPDQVKEFGYEGTRFVARKVDGEMTFLKVLAYGRINLLEFQYELQRGSEIVVDQDYFIEKNDGAGDLQKAKSGKFKKLVAELMSDNTALVQRVQSDDKKYEVSEMQEVVNEYNAWYEKQNGTFTGSR